MRFLVLLIFLLLSVPAAAGQMVHKSGDLTITLLPAPCPIPALTDAIRQAESEVPARAAIVKIGATEIPGCWGVHGDKVLVGDVFGNGGFILMKDFKEEHGV